MYCYATGSSITELEMNGHDVSSAIYTDKIVSPNVLNFDISYRMAAEPSDVRNLPEPTRIDILRRSIKQLLGYNPKKSPFSKQRHWIAIYRIAADMRLVIDGDFSYFKSIIDKMQIDSLSIPLSVSYLERSVKGIYAKNIDDWTCEGLSKIKVAEYEDIKSCADAFSKVVEKNIPKKKSSN